MNLFCIPYAGGSAYVYSLWKKYINKNIKVKSVELAGRGKKINMPLYKSFSDAVNDIYFDIKDTIIEDEYAIFGHSMGSTLAYELVHKIFSQNMPLPSHIIFSGRLPPECNNVFRKICNKSDNEFQQEILKLGGTPKEVFINKDLRNIFLPVLRADYNILENYKYINYEKKLPIDISVFVGTDDMCEYKNDMKKWKIHTEKSCTIYEFKGGHFFINESVTEVTDVINNILLNK